MSGKKILNGAASFGDIMGTNLTVSATFTKSVGIPATLLTLSEIDLYLTAIDKDDGTEVVIWDGTQNPDREIDDMGMYQKIYADADFGQYHYAARASYTGATSLDTDHVTGLADGGIISGTVDVEYTVTNTVTLLPEPGIRVEISTDLAGDHKIWVGYSGADGIARDVNNNLPALNPDRYYFWKFGAGFTDDDNPDVEDVA
jgi:hypothetical protein